MSDLVQTDKRAWVSRWEKLNRTLTRNGVEGLPNLVKTWLYWNTRPGRQLLEKRGWHPKKYGLDRPIIVYQMGKVGSSSIYNALRRLELDVPVYHSHGIAHIEEGEMNMKAAFGEVAGHMQVLDRERKLRELVLGQPKQRWMLISGVRNPVDRVISTFFQMLEPVIPDLGEKYAKGEVTLEQFHERFYKHIGRGAPRDWFDRQVKPVFGIDVYAVPFPHELGYQTYQAPRAQMLLIRFGDLNRQFGTVAREFLHIPHLELPRVNVSSEKSSGALYRDFLRTVRPPTAWLEAVLDTKLARHFYADAERAESYHFWADR